MNDNAPKQADSSPLTVRALLSSLDRFAGLDADAALQLVTLQAEEVLFSEGDSGDALYVLLSGALGVRVTRPDGSQALIDRLQPGDTVGELALLSGQRRTATIFATEEATLMRLTQAEFDQLTPAGRAALIPVDRVVLPRTQRLQLVKVLDGLFGDLQPEALRLLQDQLEWRHLTGGEILFHEGDAADGMYLVLSGRLRYTFQPPGEDKLFVGEVATGEVVGEMSLLTDEPRTATVYAARESQLARMSPQLFERLVQESPELLRVITRLVVERAQRALNQRQPDLDSLAVAIVPARSDVDAARFAAELAVALAPYGATLALDSARFDELFGKDGAAQTRSEDGANSAVVAWMSELEVENNYLIFAAEETLTPWTRRCIGQADRVLVVCDPGQQPDIGEIEQAVMALPVPVRSELVLWHPPETAQPQGTANWLALRQVHAHHHVRQGDGAHMGRLARRLSGHAIGLVLSGGAARGNAHLGVHRAMEELDIPIDYIGGTSMGALIGAGLVCHESNKAMMAQAKKLADKELIFDRTLPVSALMESKKVTKLVQQLYGDRQFEDQWIPFFCVASNLTTAEAELYERGPIWLAVRASLAIPAVFAPVLTDGNIIVDGGVIDNFPVAEMVGRCESPRIIGVNVSPFFEKKRYYDFETSIPGWRVLFSRLNPFRKALRAPGLTYVVMRTMEVNSRRHSKEAAKLADLVIEPDVRAFSGSDYDQYEAIAEAGYAAALEPLRGWWAEEREVNPGK